MVCSSIFRGGPLRESRPNWGPHQIRNIEDFIVGETYKMMLNRQSLDEIELLSIDDNNKFTYRDSHGTTKSGYLEDNGIVPYDETMWHPHRWLHKSSD